MKKNATPWYKLVNYYLQCLRTEEINRLKLKTNTQTYHLLDGLKDETLFSSALPELTLEPAISVPLHKWKTGKQLGHGTIYYAYPAIQQKTQIIPLFYVEVTLSFNRQNGQIQIKRIGQTNSNRQYFLDEEDLTRQEVADLVKEIEHLTAGTAPEKTSIPATLGKYIDQEKITFTPLVFWANETSYTSALARELKYMSTAGAGKLSAPLKYYITMLPDGIAAPPPQQLVTVVPADPAQLGLLENLNNPLAACTGPPGTGKTQTIVNLITTAVSAGQTVLMVSRNNKAVDNVYDRLVKTKTYPGVLRLGKLDVRQNTLTRISALINSLKPDPASSAPGLTPAGELHPRSGTLAVQIKTCADQEQEVQILKKRIALNLAELQNRNYNPRVRQQIETLLTSVGIPTEQHRQSLEQLVQTLQNIQHQNTGLLTRLLNYLTGNTEQKQLARYIEWLNRHFPGLLDQNDPVNILTVLHRLHETLNITLPGAELVGQIRQAQHRIETLPLPIERDQALATLWSEKTETDRAIMAALWEKTRHQLLTDPGRLATLKNLYDLEKDRFEKADKATINNWRSNFKHLLSTYPVICCTNLTLGSNIPAIPELFDLVIVDEASQNDIPSILPALYRAKHAVIVGDANQLQHITNISESQEAKIAQKTSIDPAQYSYLTLTAFDRAVMAVTEPKVHLLNNHYRSVPGIIGFSNQHFYGNRLVVKRPSLPGPAQDQHGTPLHGIHLINVDGQTIYRAKSASKSCNNPAEADQVLQLAVNYIKMGKTEIGIVTPYRSQKNLLYIKRATLAKEMPDLAGALKNIEIGTIHTFQGDEKEIIIFSTVIAKRASKNSISWFDENKNLVNVAVTRARDLLVVVGRKDTLQKSETMRKLVKYIDKLNGGKKQDPKTIQIAM